MNQMFNYFIDILQKLGLEYFGRYYSVYTGVVVDNKDPEKRGRILVKVPSIMQNNTLAQWAIPTGADLSGKGTGAFFPPYVGQTVDVLFDHGDVDYPRYMGGFWAKKELPEDFAIRYPNIRGWVFKGGQKMFFDETPGAQQIVLFNGDKGGFFVIDDTTGKEAVYIHHSKGSEFQIQPDGSMLIATKDGAMFYMNATKKELTIKDGEGSFCTLGGGKAVLGDSSGKNFVQIGKTDIEITTGGDLILTGKNINLNSANCVLGNMGDLHLAIAEKLQEWLDQHIHQSPVGPTSPPIVLTATLNNLIPMKSFKAIHMLVKGFP